MSMGVPPPLREPRRRVGGCGTGATGSGPANALDPKLLAIIEALAEAKARADYDAAFPIQDEAA